MSPKQVIFVYPLLLCVLSCTHPYGPESMEQKMGRYQGQNVKEYPTPELALLPLDEGELNKIYLSSNRGRKNQQNPKISAQNQKGMPKANRMPASATEEEGPGLGKKDGSSGKGTFQSLTNRKVYFLALYQQYQSLRQLLFDESPNIEHCPQHHSTLLEHPIAKVPLQNRHPGLQEQWSPEELPTFPKEYFSRLSDIIKEKRNLSLFPELQLPTSASQLHPTVYETLQSQRPDEYPQTVVSALKTHLEKMRGELEELCEHGQGQNYYIFENLVDHLQSSSGDHLAPPRTLKYLFRTTLFFNMTLIKALQAHQLPQGRFPASEQNESQLMEEVTQRLHAPWSVEYFHELSKRRKHQLQQVQIIQN